jgi:hypothetical protein
MYIDLETNRNTTLLTRICLCVAIVLLASTGLQAYAMEPMPDTTGSQESARAWGLSFSAMNYLLPKDPDILMFVGTADRNQLHLEARYNYEGVKVGSAFVGWNFTGGQTVEFKAIPMAGVAFGRTTGFIPALKLSVGYGIADFYAEEEYVYDLKDTEGNFFYSWLELGFTPMDMIRAGGVAQRTRIVRTPLDLDRGIFAQYNRAPAIVSLYVFNLFTESWFLVAGLTITL